MYFFADARSVSSFFFSFFLYLFIYICFVNVPLNKGPETKSWKNMRVKSPKHGYKCIKEKERENEETKISSYTCIFLLFFYKALTHLKLFLKTGTFFDVVC